MSALPLTAEVEDASVAKTGRECLLDNRIGPEDDAAVEGSSAQIRDLLTMSLTSKLDYVSSMQASYVPPRGPGGRQRGSRAEFLEKALRQKISEKVLAEFGPAPPHKPDYISTFQRDFCVEGFVPAVPETTGHDYKTDQADSFWRENNRRVQGMTATGALDSPFKKSSIFSTPITQRLDEPALPPDTS